MIILSINISKALAEKIEQNPALSLNASFRAIPGCQPEAFKKFLQEVQYLDSFRDLQAVSTTESGQQNQEFF